MKGDTSMEIIIRMEEKENPTVGAALREMANDAWVKTYLPLLIEAAKNGKTRKDISTCLHENTVRAIKETFSELGIKVSAKGFYHATDDEWYYKEIIFSWD